MAIKSILILNHSDSDSDSHTHTHTHTHTQYSPTQLCTACKEALVFVVMFSFSDGTLQHTELATHTTWSGRSCGTQCEQTGQNLGHTDLQVEEQIQPITQYSQSLHDFHGTFYTGFHPSTWPVAKLSVSSCIMSTSFCYDVCHSRH